MRTHMDVNFNPNQYIRDLIDPIISSEQTEVTTDVLKSVIDLLKNPQISEDVNLYNDLRSFRRLTKKSANPETSALENELKSLSAKVDQHTEVPGQAKLRRAISKHKPINLVLEGGGAKGILYCGILEKLEQDGILSNIRNVAGSSAGGITAFALALGYTPKEIYDLISGLDFVKLQDQKPMTQAIDTAAKTANFLMGTGLLKAATNSTTPVAAALQLASHFNESRSPISAGQLFNLFNDSHLYEGEELLKLARKLLADKGLDPEMTFEEHHQLTMKARQAEGKVLFKDLFLTGTKIDKNNNNTSSVTFCHKFTPKVKLVDAFRATASFPFAYKLHPIEIDNEVCYFSDGGIKRNYPMDIFDCEDPDFLSKDAKLVKVGPGLYSNERRINPCTLGCKVDGADECESLLRTKKVLEKAPSLGNLINSLLVDSNSGVGTYYKYNTIQGLDLNITTLNFALSPLEKLALIFSGRSCVFEYGKQKQHNFPWATDNHLDVNGKKFAAVAEDLIAISDKIKNSETLSTDRTWNAGQWIEDMEAKIARIIFSLQDDHPQYALDVGLAMLKQIYGMNKLRSFNLSGERSKLWKNLITKIVNACNDIAKTRLGAEKDVASMQNYGTDDLIRTSITGVGATAVATIGTGGAILPAVVLIGIPAVLLSVFRNWDVNHDQRFENPIFTDFKKALNKQNYQAAIEVVNSTSDKELCQLMLKEVNKFKAEFWRWSSWPKELLDLEQNLSK